MKNKTFKIFHKSEHWYDFIVKKSKASIKYELRHSDSEDWRQNLRGKLILKGIEKVENHDSFVTIKYITKLRADEFSELNTFLNAINRYSKIGPGFTMIEDKGIKI